MQKPTAANVHSAKPFLSEVWSILCPDGKDRRSFSTAQALQILKRGVSSRVINPLAAYFSMAKGELIDILELDRTTVLRWASKDQPLPRHSAETILRVLELKDVAVDVLESEEESLAWMRKAHPLLDGQSPLEAASTSYGSRVVKEILLAIKYGGVV